MIEGRSPRFLLNFSSSYTGGGLKRLTEFARFFGSYGSAIFLIHPRAAEVEADFPRNRYIVVRQPRLQRLLRDGDYLRQVQTEIGTVDLYYAYGMPLHARPGRVNWFHLSNVLPLTTTGVPLSPLDRGKMALLGRRIRHGYRYADVLSAESAASLRLMDDAGPARRVISVNGSDDELAPADTRESARENVAVVVGTYGYKRLDDSLRVFQMLQRDNATLSLRIIGDPRRVPASVAGSPGVILTGMLPRQMVMSNLRRARYYITTTAIENSYNAAAEGVFLAAQSFVSDIEPHRELLAGAPFERVKVPGVARPLLFVRRADAPRQNLKTWADVARDMISVLDELQGR